MTQSVRVQGNATLENHREINPNTGQQKGYLILTEKERAKGFVRPIRQSYVHVGRDPVFEDGVLVQYGQGGCGALTMMSLAIAETFARDPDFYDGTFCSGCKSHHPLEEFVWDGTEEAVGS